MANTKVTTGVIADDAITSAKIDSTSTGMTFADLTVTGEIVANGGIALGDSDKATFGDSDDLQIYHDGFNSYIDETGTGALFIKSSNGIYLNGKTTDEALARFIENGSVNLFYDNVQKLATTSTGIDVTGTVTSDGLTVDGATSTLKSGSSSSALIIKDAGDSQATIQFGSTNSYKMQGGSDYLGFNLLANGTTVAKFATGGDISFYEDTGTTAKLFWDASAERLGIGTTSPSTPLHIKSDSEYQLKIEATASAGASMQLYSAGTYAYTVYENSSANFRVGAYGGSSFIIRDQGNSADRLTINSSGNATFSGTISSGAISANSGTTNVVATFTSTDATAAIALTDNTGTVELSTTGTTFGIQPNGGAAVLTVNSSGNLSASGTISATGAISSSSNIASTLDLISNQDFYLSRAAGTSPAFLIPNHEFFRFITDTTGNYNQCTLGVNSSNNLYTNNAFVSTSGVYIGGTASANLLDDYEEGTFTPTVNSGTATTQWAKYTKIGDLVYIVCEITLSGTRTATTFEVGGLPFTNGPNWTPCAFYVSSYSNEGTDQVSGAFKASSSTFRVIDFGSESLGSQFGNGYFAFSGTYKIQ